MARKDGYYWVQRPGGEAALASYWADAPGNRTWWISGEQDPVNEDEFEKISDTVIEPPADFRQLEVKP